MLQSISSKKIARFYITTQIILFPVTAPFFCGVKSSKGVCAHQIEYQPPPLISKEIYFCMIAHRIHQLLHMQGCSFYLHVSILCMYPIGR